MEMNQDKKIFAANLRKFRAIAKISQEQLAELANLSQQYVCNMEGEKINPSMTTILKLARALNVTPNDLML